MPCYKMASMSWTEYQAELENSPLLLLPCGALEQHGPHLPMGTDAILAETMASRIGQQLDDLVSCIVLPAVSYGYKSQARSGGGQTFPGTTSLDGATLTGIVRDIIRELGRHGVARLAIIDGHYENQWFITEAIDLALREVAANGQSMHIARSEYWDYCPQTVLDAVFDGDFPGYDLEHAALIETSMMLAIDPKQVRLDSLPAQERADFVPHDHYPQDGRGVPVSGVLAPTGDASAEKGELIISATAEAIAAAFKAEFLAA